MRDFFDIPYDVIELIIFNLFFSIKESDPQKIVEGFLAHFNTLTNLIDSYDNLSKHRLKLWKMLWLRDMGPPLSTNDYETRYKMVILCLHQNLEERLGHILLNLLNAGKCSNNISYISEQLNKDNKNKWDSIAMTVTYGRDFKTISSKSLPVIDISWPFIPELSNPEDYVSIWDKKHIYTLLSSKRDFITKKESFLVFALLFENKVEYGPRFRKLGKYLNSETIPLWKKLLEDYSQNYSIEAIDGRIAKRNQ